MAAVRIAGEDDAPAIAELSSAWAGAAEPGFEARIAGWLATEGDRRTTWLAEVDGGAAGMVSLFEYRRMPKPGRPDSRWGYVSNLFVNEALRGRGLGGALLATLAATADERGYARLVVSPSERARPLYARAGFVAADGDAGVRMLVRTGRG